MTGRFASDPTLARRVHGDLVIPVKDVEDTFKSIRPCRRRAVYQEEKLRGVRGRFVGREPDGLQVRIAVGRTAVRQPGIVRVPQRLVECVHRLRIRAENECPFACRERAREKLR